MGARKVCKIINDKIYNIIIEKTPFCTKNILLNFNFYCGIYILIALQIWSKGC